MCGDEVVQTEGLRRLCPYQLVSRDTCGGGESVLTFEDCLAAFDSRYGIAVFLSEGYVGGYYVLREQRAHGIVHEYEVFIVDSGIL